jgi:DNA polymerase-3 subunit gamma/tau
LGQALYRKYRSKNLDEIVGQSAVTTALNNALKSGKISHAYLFTGPRGVGKTSIARILAHEVNGIDYISDELPMDIIEIDAASNRRIDEIRDLREKINIAPVSAKYKVYIIDEVHMLTKEAFNALLKTLEEPPAHVIFILATTEAHKLPETIISRTQRYNFRLASVNEVEDHLKSIAKKENIKIDSESIEIIAKHSGGSLRDAISILDQIRHISNNITGKMVRLNIGLPSETIVSELIDAYKSKEPKSIIETLKNVEDDGVSSNLLATQLIEHLRKSLADEKPILPIKETISLVEELMKVENSQRPDIQLEIALLSAQINNPAGAINSVSEARVETDASDRSLSVPAQSLKSAAHDVPDSIDSDNLDNLEQAWPKVIQKIRQTHSTLYSVINMANVDYSQQNINRVILSFKYPFYLKRMKEAKNKNTLSATIAEIGLGKFEIVCEDITKDKVVPSHKSVINKMVASDNINNLRAVFGSAEVLD